MELLKCVSYIDKLNIEDLEAANIGLEIQDFVEPELLDGDYKERVDLYKKKLEGFNQPVVIHGPFLDLKPASPDMEIRRVSIEKYRKALEVARELEAGHIVFHSQINPWINQPDMRRLNNQMQKDFWDDLLDNVEYEGMILLENVFEDDPILLKELIENIDRPNIKVCLDIGHSRLACISGLKYWIYELRDHIEYVHLHWNEGKYDSHDSPKDEELRYIFNSFREFDIRPKFSIEYETDSIKREVERLELLYHGGKVYD